MPAPPACRSAAAAFRASPAAAARRAAPLRAVVAQAVAAPAATPAATSAKSQYELQTLTTWLLDLEKNAVIDNELAAVISSIATACKQIGSLVNRAGISNLTGLAGQENVQGEDQKKLDVISNEVFGNCLRSRCGTGTARRLHGCQRHRPLRAQWDGAGSGAAAGLGPGVGLAAWCGPGAGRAQAPACGAGAPTRCRSLPLPSLCDPWLDLLDPPPRLPAPRSGRTGVIASEEEDLPVAVEETFSGEYVVVFDPLDGSSNIDAGISVGSIFGIYEPSPECSIEDMDDPGAVGCGGGGVGVGVGVVGVGDYVCCWGLGIVWAASWAVVGAGSEQRAARGEEEVAGEGRATRFGASGLAGGGAAALTPRAPAAPAVPLQRR